MMGSHELEEFHKRCVAARVKNRKIAHAESHVAALEAEVGPVAPRAHMHKHSPEHLIALIEKAIKVRAGEEEASVKAKPKAEKKESSKEKPKAEKKESKKKDKDSKKESKKKDKEEIVEAAPEEQPKEEAPASIEDAPKAEEVPKEEA